MDDLLVVGGGPVGLTAAIHAAQAGMSVRVLEAKPGVIDKACGEGLMPGGVESLREMGVRIDEYRPFKGIRYVDGKRTATGHFIDGIGWGIRRTTLHAGLQRRALELGVTIEQQRVSWVEQTHSSVTCHGFEGRYLIAADGLKSPIRRQLALQKASRGPARYGLRRHFQVVPWTPDYVEIHLARDAEAYVTPVADDMVGVAILFGEKFRQRLQQEDEGERFYDRALAEFPELQQHCQIPCSRIQGSGPFKTELRRRYQGRILLAGDAAGYLDPMTGEGVRLGMATAKAAVRAVQHNNPRQYERAWRQLSRRYWLATSAVLEIRRSPLLTGLVVPTLAQFPRLFDWTLAQMEK